MIIFNVVGKEMNGFDTLHFQRYSVLATTFSTHTLFFLLFLPLLLIRRHKDEFKSLLLIDLHSCLPAQSPFHLPLIVRLLLTDPLLSVHSAH